MNKRPSRYSDEIARATAEALYPQVKEYLEEQDCFDENEKEDVIQQVAHAIRYEDDGYKIVRELEHEGWDGEASLVDLFENRTYTKRDAEHEKAIAEWVKKEGIRPAKKVGDLVVTTHATPHAGTVVRVDERTASYVINSPAFGHKPPDLTKDFNEGRYFPWEEVLNGVLPPA